MCARLPGEGRDPVDKWHERTEALCLHAGQQAQRHFVRWRYIRLGEANLGTQEQRCRSFHEEVPNSRFGLARSARHDGIRHRTREGNQGVESCMENSPDRRMQSGMEGFISHHSVTGFRPAPDCEGMDAEASTGAADGPKGRPREAVCNDEQKQSRRPGEGRDPVGDARTDHPSLNRTSKREANNGTISRNPWSPVGARGCACGLPRGSPRSRERRGRSRGLGDLARSGRSSLVTDRRPTSNGNIEARTSWDKA